MDISKDMTATPGTIRRVDYTPPPFLIETVDLDVELGQETTGVVARLAVRRNPAAATSPPIWSSTARRWNSCPSGSTASRAVHEVTSGDADDPRRARQLRARDHDAPDARRTTPS